MSTMLVDFAAGTAIFVLGIALTIRRFGGQDYPVMILAAVLTPFLAVFSVFGVLYLAVRGRLRVDPCPDGLEEAEKIVEIQRQQMFGGPIRESSIALSWRRAYQQQLQLETRKVQSIARRYLVMHAE